jgi:AcrR family transcriptional regulator
MRVKTETKKQAILDEALRLFREVGYESASMSELSRRVGGSKSTIYNYFVSKEQIFLELIFHLFESDISNMFLPLENVNESIDIVLTEFGRRSLTLAYHEDVIVARKLAISESERAHIGQDCYDRAIVITRKKLKEYFQTKIDQSMLRCQNADIAAAQFMALLKAEFDVETLLGLKKSLSQEEIEGYVQRAVGVFIAAYKIG